MQKKLFSSKVSVEIVVKINYELENTTMDMNLQ